MKLPISRTSILLIVCMLSSGICISAQDDGNSAYDALKSREGAKRDDSPTVITADTLEVDMANNNATLLGNVNVEDQDVNIKCTKMILYLENKEEPEKDAKSQKKENEEKSGGVTVGDPGDNKQLSRIECFGNVAITRKMRGEETEEVQKASGEKAVYDLKNDTITLTEKAVVIQGGRRMEGEMIIFHPKTGNLKAILPVIKLDSLGNGIVP